MTLAPTTAAESPELQEATCRLWLERAHEHLNAWAAGDLDDHEAAWALHRCGVGALLGVERAHDLRRRRSGRR